MCISCIMSMLINVQYMFVMFYFLYIHVHLHAHTCTCTCRSKLFLAQSQMSSETIPNMSHSTLGHPLSSSSSSVLHTPVRKGQTSQGLLPPPELVTSELIQTARDDINKLEQQLVSN